MKDITFMFHTYESRLVAVQDLGFNRPASFFSIS